MKQKPESTFTCDGLGTEWHIEILVSSTPIADLQPLVQTSITKFNDTYSRFIDTSLIGQLHARSVLQNPPPELVEMFAFAHDMFRQSLGGFNISVAGPLNALGYGSRKDAGTVDDDFWEKTVYTADEISIPPHSRVDLGGFGKGWLLDKLGCLLETNGVTEYIINGGGDILVRSDSPIELAIEHPTRPGTLYDSVTLSHGALGVSSTRKRTWKSAGAEHHHIIDPLTGTSLANGIVGSYVVAPTALLADSLATIAMIRPDLRYTLSRRNHANIQLIGAPPTN